MGADAGSSAGADNSAISIGGLAEFSDGLFELLADLARNASFPEDQFERERRQKIEGLRVERTTPGFLANERMRRVLFGDHRYAVIAPTEEQVAAYRRSELQHFYQHHYAPSNALLLVVGDFSSDHMLAQIEKAFGSWKGSRPEMLISAAPPEALGRQVHLVHLPGAVQTQVLVGNLAITRRDPDWFRTVLANSIYGGAFHSRLVMNIREQKGYTYSPRSGITALHQHGFFTVHAAVRNEVTAATLTEMFYEMDRMRSLPSHPRRTRKRAKLPDRRFLARCRHAGRRPRPAFNRLPRPLARRLPRNLSRKNSRPNRRRHFARRPPPLRLRQRPNRPGRRPRPNLRPSHPIRPSNRIHSQWPQVAQAILPVPAGCYMHTRPDMHRRAQQCRASCVFVSGRIEITARRLVLSLPRPRPRPKNSPHSTRQPQHRHNRPTRNPPRHRPKHREIHRRFPKSQRPIPTRRRPARHQRNLQIKTRKAAPVRHSRTSTTQPALRQLSTRPSSHGFRFTQFSESHVTITASRSDLRSRHETSALSISRNSCHLDMRQC